MIPKPKLVDNSSSMATSLAKKKNKDRIQLHQSAQRPVYPDR